MSSKYAVDAYRQHRGDDPIDQIGQFDQLDANDRIDRIDHDDPASRGYWADPTPHAERDDELIANLLFGVVLGLFGLLVIWALCAGGR